MTVWEWHTCGIEQLQNGEYASAVESLSRSVSLRPSVPAFHVDLAEAYRLLGQPSRTAGCCRTALSMRPDFPEAYNTLGLALQALDRRDEAVNQFQHALSLRPDMVAALNNLGVVLQELSRAPEAIDCFRRVAALAPDIFRVRTNLGLALLSQGHAADALPHLQEAARLQPDMAVLHQNLAKALVALERHADARAAYLEASRLDPETAENYHAIGLTLRHEGQLGGAATWFKLATNYEQANPSHWEQLAEVHVEREHFDEAIPCWERVLSLAPSRPATAHNNLGWSFQQEGRLVEAKHHFEAALRLQPDLAAAHVHLGGIHEELGDMPEAETAFRAALRMQPMLPSAHARLATLLRDKLPDPDLGALESLLSDPRLNPSPRCRLLFGLAHVLDARGDYVRASTCLHEANALDAEESRGERQYSPADHDRFIDGLVNAFTPEFFERTAGFGLESRRPVFVLGLPRSGTTLIEQILASHPQVHGGGELRFARQSFETMPEVLHREGPPIESVPHLDESAIHRLAEKHLENLHALDGGNADRIVNKMPDNYLYLGLLGAMFPRAVFIHARRDLRDIAVSCWMTDFRSIRWAGDPAHIANRFQNYRRVMAHWRRTLTVPILDVNYEDTVSDLEGVARRLVSACGLNWNPACLEFYRTRRSIRTASVVQVRQPIYTRSVARWKHYEHDLAELFSTLATLSDDTF
jgi:tetratricopeptide (TPR) repeat protein